MSVPDTVPSRTWLDDGREDPRALHDVVIRVAEQALWNTVPSLRVPPATLRELEAQIEAELKRVRDWPRLIDEATRVLVRALALYLAAKADASREASGWFDVSLALLTMIKARQEASS